MSLAARTKNGKNHLVIITPLPSSFPEPENDRLIRSRDRTQRQCREGLYGLSELDVEIRKSQNHMGTFLTGIGGAGWALRILVRRVKHNVPMRIFISSVRRGLEVERDALPGLIKALGHEPVRFEDFSAQSAPSREACINGVESSDAYLLILGPHYGTVFPETGQSATHDEWVAAQRAGIARYVFRKSGSTFDVEQQQFENSLGEYGSGRFYKAFSDVSELQQAVVASIRELEATPESLDFEPLQEIVEVRWLLEEEFRNQFSSSERCLLEIHVVPIHGRPVSARILDEVGAGLPGQVRNAGLVSAAQGVELDHFEGGVIVRSPAPSRRGGSHETHDGSLAAVLIRKSGETTVTFRLPGDIMGSILDLNDLSRRLGSALRLAGQVDVSGAGRFAIGVGITSTSMVAVGELGRGPRNSVGMHLSSAPLHLEPDETVSRAALDRGAGEVATMLARSLIRTFQNST